MLKTPAGLAIWGLVLLLLTQVVQSFPQPRYQARSLHGQNGHAGRSKYTKRRSNDTSCNTNLNSSITAPKANPFRGLSQAETVGVASWLFSNSDLNLTTTDEAGEWDNTVVMIEILPPNKTDVLAYLDGGAPEPTRYAHVTLQISSVEDAHYSDIMVGPLPIDNSTVIWTPLEYPYSKQDKGRVRNTLASWPTMDAWRQTIVTNMSDITDFLFNTSVDQFVVWGTDPYYQDNGRITKWDNYWGPTTGDMDTQTLIPLGLYFFSDITGRDPSQYTFEGIWYNEVFYESVDAFRNAVFSPGFNKIAVNTDGPWGSTDQTGEILPKDTFTPPTNVAPTGGRYAVDLEQKYVKWMDFEFYLSFSSDTGMHLNDIRYKGERIIYELGLQEALAHYAANDPWQSSISYLDSYYGFGPNTNELVSGYDCPSYSTYLNSSVYAAESTITHMNSICIFEHDPAYPMQHHSTASYTSVTKNIMFTVRTICTIGNYDYMFSYEFFLDGTINVDLRASGYIQSTIAVNNSEYGYKITTENLSGSMHDHVLNFKVDMDIKGVNNTIEVTEIVPTTEIYPWSKGKPRNTMKLKRSRIENEDDGKLFWGANAATSYHVINTDHPNMNGEFPGYRIMPSAPVNHLAVSNSSNLVNAANWASHDLFVTRQHDTEPRSAHPYNSQDLYDPPIDFNDFFNGESLLQEDLVLWFNLGTHHVPHTGDLPNTVYTTAHSAIMLTPVNYLLTNPSRQTVNMVKITTGFDNNSSTVDIFGQQVLSAECEVSVAAQKDVLSQYQGAFVVQKFPWNASDAEGS